MIRRIAIAAGAATIAALLTAIPGSASAGPATTPTAWPADKAIPLPLGRFTGMAVDQADGLVFYSGDDARASDGYGGGVVVSHLDGTALASVAGTTAASAITLGPDGKVYAIEETGVIAAIDPATLAVTDHPTGDAKCPTSIAFAGSALWFTYQCGSDGANGLATIDLATDTVTTGLTLQYASPPPTIATVPGHPDLLAGSDLAGKYEVDLIGINGTTAAINQQTAAEGGPSITVTPDGSTILATSPWLGGAGRFSTTDLSQTAGVYAPGGGAETASVSADGALVAVAAGEDASTDTISTFYAGNTTPIRTYDTSTPGEAGQGQNTNPAYGGIGWTGSTLLAVYVDYLGDWPLLKVLNSALQTPTAMTFSGPASASRTGRITLTGQLPSDLSSAPVTITKRDLSGVHTLGTATTGSTGKFTYLDAPGVGGTDTYTATYAGDKTHAPVSKSWNVAVSRQTVTMSIALDHGSYNYHQIAHLAIHVASHNQKTVQVWAKFGHQPLHLLRTLTLDSRGVAHMDSMLTYDTLYQLRFAGDYVYNPRTVTTTAYTRVAIAGGLYGYYGTSGAYRLYHYGSDATIGGMVAPDKTGGCLRFESQYYWHGQWVNGDSLSCQRMQYSSGTDAYFSASRGLPIRVRVVYNTEATNLGNASALMYLVFR